MPKNRTEAVRELVKTLTSSGDNFIQILQQRFSYVLDSPASQSFKDDIMDRIHKISERLTKATELAWFNTDLTTEEIRSYTEFMKTDVGMKIINTNLVIANAMKGLVNTELNNLDRHIIDVTTTANEQGNITVQ